MSSSDSIDLNQYVRDVPDFPKPGILFKDITPLLAHPEALRVAVARLADHFRDSGVTVVAAAEARGFLFGPPLALALNIGFVPIRKPGKLPYDRIGLDYALEYGSDRLEVHRDAFRAGDRVLLLDDVLATGGTMAACRDLVQQAGAEVAAFAFVIELTFLDGRSKLGPGGPEIYTVLSY